MICDRKDLLLYAVTDRSWLNGGTLYRQVEMAVRGGATFVQLREKELVGAQFLEEAVRIRDFCKKNGVPFVVNDDARLACRLNADGVHVGQEDMGIKEARKLLGPDKIIGVSAHTVEEALRAEKDGADYLGAGAVFPTGSKANVSRMTYETLSGICKAVKIPVIAIGGIGMENVMRLAGSGISGVAVISAIFAQKDIKEAAAALKERVIQMLKTET